MLCCPEAHQRQCPQDGMKAHTTWSPCLTRETPGPTFSTIPAPSCPPMYGSSHRQVAGHQVHVGVAQPGRDVPDQDLVLLRIADVDFHDLPGLIDPGQYGGFALH